jgi:hypothetical protein
MLFWSSADAVNTIDPEAPPGAAGVTTLISSVRLVPGGSERIGRHFATKRYPRSHLCRLEYAGPWARPLEQRTSGFDAITDLGLDSAEGAIIAPARLRGPQFPERI